ncbi:unnamed protein product [Orchesella dallaii]|uniref:Uncharacterized protein n=1 Tax=Orchesella dallaii TaxID=48710 RepID=A0ABP1RLC4_9HEXA
MFQLITYAMVLTLLVSSMSFGTSGDCPNPTLSKLFPHFNSNWERYVLYFLQNKEYHPDAQISPHHSIKSRILAAEDSEGKPMSRGAYRISNTVDVIITKLQPEFEPQLRRIEYIFKYLVPSRSIILFINENLGERTLIQNLDLTNWRPGLEVFAALKLIVTLPQQSQCSLDGVSVTVICSGYCSSTPRPLADIQKAFLQNDLYSLHHSLFWNANGKVLPALVRDSYQFLKDPKITQVCFTPTVRLNHKCEEGIPTMLTYGEIHNMSMDLKPLDMTNVVKYGVIDVNKGPEQLTHTLAIKSKTPSAHNQLTFMSFGTRSLIYCPRVKNSERYFIEFQIWYEPFPFTVWLLVFSCIIFGIICCLMYHHRLHAVLGKVLCFCAAVFGASHNPRYFIHVAALAFLLSQIYSNGITSIITVGRTPEGFKNVRELLQARYKILVDTELEQKTGEGIYGADFNRLGLSTAGAFEMADRSDIGYLSYLAILKNARYAFSVPTAWSKYYEAVAIGIITEQNWFEGGFTCSVLAETLVRTQSFSLLETENQQWVYVTLQRIRAAGLSHKWDEWSQWQFKLFKRVLDKKFQPKPEFVDRPKILAMQMVWGTLLLVSLIFFCLEKGVLQGANWMSIRGQLRGLRLRIRGNRQRRVTSIKHDNEGTLSKAKPEERNEE